MKYSLIAPMIVASAMVASAPAAAQDWTAQVAPTERGYLIGNPDAPVQLITFLSYSCPHCKTFEQEADAELKADYIHDGSTSVEVRPAIRNVLDLSATLLATCGPSDRFLGNQEAFFATQGEWLGKAQQITPEQKERWQSATIGHRLKAIASDLGFYELMEARGYTEGELDACLTDEARAETVVNNSEASRIEYPYPGTPSFVVNGTLLDGVFSWAALKPELVTE
ncbi:thioredoxin domain-containing protein [Aurantiacibacter suaedae]|uniref:thioredoxin domain-containing protein n=1 Tax=Aurantiacibacter suaedae TaxID=2545755 RepID=UPI0010F629A6|nr:thioredoxin domain-containing protein [Aurantiacibacter suaedae]